MSCVECPAVSVLCNFSPPQHEFKNSDGLRYTKHISVKWGGGNQYLCLASLGGRRGHYSTLSTPSFPYRLHLLMSVGLETPG